MARAAQQITKPAEDAAPPTAESPERDSPVLDLTDAGVKKLIKAGKAAGYVTYDQLNAALPAEMTASEQIEDTLAMLNDMGIMVVEGEDGELDGLVLLSVVAGVEGVRGFFRSLHFLSLS